jgi:ATP-dependent helicase/nuclease subunit A
MPVLEPDSLIRLPSVTVLRASAGSGKTFALTERYVQFLLSPAIPKNDLGNILAITFSNNASREMREKVLEWLKRLAFRDHDRLAEICAVTEGGEERAASRAAELLEQILSHYSDFQVRTIDSFMSMVFRASALDFGFSPEFEILLDPAPLLDYAFNLFLRGAREGTARAALLDETVRAVLALKAGEDRFHWDPAAPLLAETKKLEDRLSMIEQAPSALDVAPLMQALEGRIRGALERVRALVDSSGLEPSARSTFPDLLAQGRAGRFADMIGRGMKSCPVKKPGPKDERGRERYETIEEAWSEADGLVSEYTACWARAYYQPYLRLHADLAQTIEKVKRGQGKVFIGDINRALGGYLAAEIVPDIYFRLGERVFHYLIDEFQDTSPIQWRNLAPLVENSLAMGGSLFVVGDTKQAIYGFRQADYTIMRALEAASPFPSAGHVPLELDTNWRSRPRILEFAAEVFRGAAAGSPQYAEAARRSGLARWTQKPLAGEDPGYVEVEILERDEEDPPERRKIHVVLEQLRARGYRWGDIALLASKNEEITRATSWLNEKAVPFISFSSLDVRGRKVAAEMLALLGFLDSPPDDLAFATFLLGGIFASALAARRAGVPPSMHSFLFRCRQERPLYKAFQREFPELWRELFAGLFRSAGYLPLYDLVSESYTAFRVFDAAREEEATLAKLLEKVKEFEGSGSNSLREFLGSAGSAGDGGEWAIDVPRGADSVRAMTVHKAKGLGFPVVIALLYGEGSRGFEHTILREAGGIGLVKLTQEIAARDPQLKQLYDEEATKEKVNRLNALYVALTRARRELYVVGVKRPRDSFPFDLLPASGFAPSADKGTAAAGPGEAEPVAELSHETRSVRLAFSRGSLNREERRRGDLAHRMLSLVREPGDDLEAALAEAAERAGLEAREVPAAAGLAEAAFRLIMDTELRGYFTPAPGRTILTEQEFCDADGRLRRMDRVVADPDRVTVIDFKTGPEAEDEHVQEIQSYARILEGAYPGRRVEAILAYLDRREARRVL